MGTIRGTEPGRDSPAPALLGGKSMMNKELLTAFGLLVGTGVFVVANGMDAQFAFSSSDARQPVIGVAAGAPAGDRGAAMELELYRCGAETPTKSAQVPFAAASLAEFAAMEHLPVQTSGEHAFSETYWTVDEGCYFVTSRPVDGAGRPIDDCTTARTPDTFVDNGHTQEFALVSSCDRPVPDRIEVAGRLNHAPTVASMAVDRIEDSQSCDTIEICATARDLDADPMVMHWSVSTEPGDERAKPLHLPAPVRSEGETHLTECVEITPGTGSWSVDVTVRDQLRDDLDDERPRLIAYEDYYLGNWGLVANSRDTRSVSIDADCDKATCPEDPKERITDLNYWITRDGRLLAPTDDLSRVQEGDMVDVEFEVAPGCTDTQVTFASYTGERREKQASVFSRTYDPGPHLLWNVLPDCKFRADVHLGPPLGDEERPGADNPYGEHLIDSFAGGEASCDEHAAR
jgi:hypothetical protein